jgi:hypothetical protein
MYVHVNAVPRVCTNVKVPAFHGLALLNNTIFSSHPNSNIRPRLASYSQLLLGESESLQRAEINGSHTTCSTQRNRDLSETAAAKKVSYLNTCDRIDYGAAIPFNHASPKEHGAVRIPADIPS